MNNYYLKADTAEELQTALKASGLVIVSEEGDESYYGEVDGFVIDWIGQISEQTGTQRVDTGEVDEFDDPVYTEEPVFTTLPGYHCNIYSPYGLPVGLQDYAVSPSPATPYRKLAGT